jgi:preprotein translocase subunit YajC
VIGGFAGHKANAHSASSCIAEYPHTRHVILRRWLHTGGMGLLMVGFAAFCFLTFLFLPSFFLKRKRKKKQKREIKETDVLPHFLFFASFFLAPKKEKKEAKKRKKRQHLKQQGATVADSGINPLRQL